jgi:hypothetical protein
LCRHHFEQHRHRHPHPHGLRLRHLRSSPTGFGRRHHHQHLDVQHGPLKIGHRHGCGDVSLHGTHHRGPRGRHQFRHGFADIGIRSHGGPHCRRRLHRSLSPHHLMHDRSMDRSRGSPHRGCRRHREHDEDRQSCEHRYHQDSHSQELNRAGSQSNPSFPIPAAIEQGIEQFGQLTLRS